MTTQEYNRLMENRPIEKVVENVYNVAEGYELRAKTASWPHDEINTWIAKDVRRAADALKALALPIPDDGPKPWPPPEDVWECLAFHSRFGQWGKATKRFMGWEMDEMPCGQDLTHWLPMPPAPGGGK